MSPVSNSIRLELFELYKEKNANIFSQYYLAITEKK